MKQTVLFSAMVLAATGVAAQEVGNVISASPVIQQVAMPRTVCSPVAPTQVQTTGAGGVVGGLTGAAIGSTIGQGSGNAAAIAAGTIIGAIVGNNVEAQDQRYAQTGTQCVTQNQVENHIVAYDVVYEYHGRRYSARMPYDPGRTVELQMQQTTAQAAPVTSQTVTPVQAVDANTPVPVVTAPVPVATTTVQASPVVVQAPAPVVYQAYPSYPAYPYPYPYGYAYPYPYYRPYFPVGVSLGFVFGGGGGHHHH